MSTPTASTPRIVPVLGSKGGTGRTTAVVQLAAALARQGRRVAVMDTTALGDTTEWIQDARAALPDGALRLASNATTEVQAAEIRCGDGVFWGVQYHPEISLFEAAAALRRQADDLVQQGLATSVEAVEEQAQLVEALHDGNTTGTGPFYRNARMTLGPSACLRIGDVRVVVRDDHRGAPGQHAFQHLAHPRAGRHVQRTHGLVQQDHARVRGQGALQLGRGRPAEPHPRVPAAQPGLHGHEPLPEPAPHPAHTAEATS